MTAEEALRLHHESFLFDGHNDVALRLFAGEDVAGGREGGHLDLPRMREGGFDGGVFAVWVDPEATAPLERTLEGVRRLRAFLEETPGVRPILRAAELETAERSGEVAALIGVEGGYAIEDDVEAVDTLHAAGVRCLTLTWMRPTAWADASGVPAVHGGLTPFGERVVERLRRLGMLVDVSHSADPVVERLLALGDGPLVASHSGARTVARHHRNLPDPLLEGIARSGGVVGVNLFSAYLDERFGRGFEELRERLGVEGSASGARLDRAAGSLPPVPLTRVFEHAEHVASVAGVEAVGLGSDFDGMTHLPAGLRDVRDLPRITLGLAERGWRPAGLRAFLGENFRRVLGAVLG